MRSLLLTCALFLPILVKAQFTTQPENDTACSGGTAQFSVVTSGGPYTYQWQVSTTGTGGTYNNISTGPYSGITSATLNITNTAGLNGYAYRVNVTSGSTTASNGATLLVDVGVPAIGVQPGNAAICPNGSTIFSATATNGAKIVYRWQVSTDGGSNYSNISDGGVYSGAQTNSLTITGAPVTMYGYRYRLTATNQCGTTNSNGAILTFSTTWTGTSSINWNVSGNWSCGVPDQNTDAVIPSTGNSPTVNVAGAVRNLTINSGATLTIGDNNSLSIYGNASNLGIFNAGGTGATTNYSSTVAQTLPGATYANLSLSGGGNKNLGGAMTINGTLSFSGNTRLFMGANTTTLGAAATITGYNSTNYIVTNGTGFLKRGSISTASGTVDFPIGTNSAYTPVQLANAGTSDNFSARVIDGVYVNYIGNTPVGAPITNRVVNKTWFVAEDAAGSSDATLTVQWNATDELGTFNRSSVTLSHYISSKWQGKALVPVSGTNPYRTSRSNITSFSPFGVGNGGTPLPLNMLSFTGTKVAAGVLLNWETAEEKNMDGFSIERSEDGASFRPIGNVAAMNKPDARQRYQYTDKAVGNGKYYYRLRIKDYNGTDEFSNMVVIQHDNASVGSSFMISPNPVDGAEIYIQATGRNEGNLEISVTDMAGKRWYQQTATLSGDRLPVNIKALPAGTYMLRLQQGSSVQSIKIVRN